MADGELASTFIPVLHKPPSLLPIAKHKEALLYTIDTCPVTIAVGQTGSGKTTQLPQYLADAGWCNDGRVVACTQPRRVAATTVAARVAEERRCQLGQEVGYSIRFEDVTSAATRIKFLTDGLLLREALVDPLLSRYSVVMVDEAHERSLSSDILLGVLKKIMKRRPELRVVVSSATLQAEDFLRFFAGTEGDVEKVGRIVSVEGRMFPVDIQYLTTPCEDYLSRAIDTVFSIHASEPAGDILVFLTGREEIDTALQMTADCLLDLPKDHDPILALPLYAGLPTDQQLHVFAPAPQNTRKVIFATNIAEASVTIAGIAHVIDSGFVKLRAYNPRTGIETLTPVPVSQASATQRAGRAGRTAPGKCYRLYPSSAFTTLPAATVPEIQRANLAPTILLLKALGIDNIARFAYPTPPPAEQLTRALELLYALGAMDPYARLTAAGTRMADLALAPMLSCALLAAPGFFCVSEMLSLAAMLSVQGDVWRTPSARAAFAVEEGDHLTLLNVYTAFAANARGDREAKWCHEHGLDYKRIARARSIRAQLCRALARFGITEAAAIDAAPLREGKAGMPEGEAVRRCLTTGYFAHAARMQADGTLRTVDGGAALWVHPSSVLFGRRAEWVVFDEVVEMRGKTYVMRVSKVEKGWLAEYGGGYYGVGE